jgi:hypothetical protein
MDFSFWGFVKDNVYILPMPVDFQELQDRIVNAIAPVHITFLGKLWVELQYRLNVCHITRGTSGPSRALWQHCECHSSGTCHFLGQTVGQIRISSGCLPHDQGQQYWTLVKKENLKC